MKRGTTWGVFGLCFAVVLGVMGWVSMTALDLDRMQVEAEKRALLEEQVRLALWRMDSLLTPMIARETRPHRTFTAMQSEPPPPDVLLRFLVNHDGVISTSSPGRETQLAAFIEVVDRESLQRALPESPLFIAEPMQVEETVTYRYKLPKQAPTTTLALNTAGKKKPRSKRKNPQKFALRSSGTQQKVKSVNEWNKRTRNFESQFADNSYANPYNRKGTSNSIRGLGSGSLSSGLGLRGTPSNQGYYQDTDSHETPQRSELNEVMQIVADTSKNVDANVLSNAGGPGPADGNVAFRTGHRTRTRMATVREGVMMPVWIDDVLVLARRAVVDEKPHLEGSWLDWPGIEATLLDEISDLLPSAGLVAVRDDIDDTDRLLATLPVRLVPGPILTDPLPTWTPLKISLSVAWICVLVAAGAVFVLLLGAMSLSERRGAFVSAVTHELRTPLTTFRMYTEMLTEGMVPDEEKKMKYLHTLRREADRLGSLVENVLVYAQVEGNRYAQRIEEWSVQTLLDQVQTRLSERAIQAGMTLELTLPEGAGEVMLRADPGATDQILFNLVDNAAKYAAGAKDTRVHLEVTIRAKQVTFTVRDHGPGIPKGETRRVFRPFSKSSDHVAGTTPGVGLGLALSKRLARHMKGELVLDRRSEGAAFSLTLPRA